MAGRRLLLVRHAEPVVDLNVAAPLWHLSGRGRLAAAAMAPHLPHVRAVWSSQEPKALETAHILAEAWDEAVWVHPDLAEARLALGPLEQEEFARRVRRYLDGFEEAADEPRAQAKERVVAAVRHILGEGPSDVAVVSHGRILTLLLEGLLGRPLGARHWERIAMPDWTLLDSDRWTVLAGFAAAFDALG